MEFDYEDDFDEALYDAALDILREHGPLSDDDWVELLLDAGHGDEFDLYELVEYFDHDLVGTLHDGRNIALDRLLRGRVFTHRLTESEIASGVVEAATDLRMITRLMSIRADAGPEDLAMVFGGLDADALTERGVRDPEWPEEGILLPTRDALSGFAAGDLVAFTIDDSAKPRVLERPANVSAPPAGLGARLRAYLEDGADEVDLVLAQVLHEDAALFTSPTVPIEDIFEEASIERNVDHIAPTGFDFAAARHDEQVERVGALQHLRPDEAEAVVTFADLVDAVAAGQVPTVVPDSVALLSQHDVAQAAVGGVFGGFSMPSVDAVTETADLLLRRGPRRMAAAAHWIKGVAAQYDGDVVAAERHFERAESADSRWDPALYELARYASDRGDAVRALSLLGRTEDGLDDPLYALLQKFVPVVRPGLGRNDKCWCGSGRKYKVCHLGKAEFTLTKRSEWLYVKAARFAEEFQVRMRTLSLAVTRSEVGEIPLLDALRDPFVQDVSLFEGGTFGEFLQRRGSLLPSDEALLAEQWLLRPRSVFEVVDVRPGEGMTVRDLRTGDHIEVVERSGSRQVHPGFMFCSRVVPVGDEWQIYGGIEPVSLTQRVPLLELLDDPDTEPTEVVEFLSGRLRPPTMVTNDGTPMVACTATFEVRDKGIRRKLSRRFGAGSDDEWLWTEGDRLLGVLRLRSESEPWVLEIEAMNEPRFDALLDEVDDIEGVSRKLSEERVPAAEMMARAAESGPPEPQQPHPPEVMAMIAEKMREFEQNWLDESIPALEGFTPRQAAADPTRRDDVVRLLASFPQEDRPDMMSAQRLRAALGL